ncbi:MAG: hypothetical protein FWF59_04350 [Turicibacter sp.]|nr:hypothetical protein [Turicibacter sp.]
MSYLANQHQKNQLLKLKVKDFSLGARNLRNQAQNIFLLILGLAIGVGGSVGFLAQEGIPSDIEGWGLLLFMGGGGFYMAFGLPTWRKEEIPTWMKEIEETEGSLEYVLEEIRDHIRKGLPVYTAGQSVIVHQERFYIVGDWWVDYNGSKDCASIFRFSDVVAITGTSKLRTRLVMKGGTQQATIFGKGQWWEVFELLHSLRPDILGPDDVVSLPDGRELDVTQIIEEIAKEQSAFALVHDLSEHELLHAIEVQYWKNLEKN